ncbi:unnamed protein product [Thlaspi arvense]|uniref:Uncharacterized protein n=1 Tax=Thlaspi arvense TaxID=13288 RepID=A0AAU9REW1_THLAR|nr:unnamed protein product [Thlaspi arvense]
MPRTKEFGPINSSTNRLTARNEDPPSIKAILAASAISFTLFLGVSSPSISDRMAPAISSAFTISPFAETSTAKPNSFTIVNAFSCCSAYIGHVAIGTPNHKLSSTEFQPQ